MQLKFVTKPLEHGFAIGLIRIALAPQGGRTIDDVLGADTLDVVARMIYKGLVVEQELLQTSGQAMILSSYCRARNYWDNAMIGSFYGSRKCELRYVNGRN